MELDVSETWQNGAIMNVVTLDVQQEEQAVEMVDENIMKAGEVFFTCPMERPFIPCWIRVVSAVPDIFEELVNAVEEDHKEFSNP